MIELQASRAGSRGRRAWTSMSSAGGLDQPGTPILLVHGLASNARLWDGVATRLAAAGHPVAAVDQRGHGQSAKPDSGYDFATLTDDLLTVVAALAWDRAIASLAGRSELGRQRGARGGGPASRRRQPGWCWWTAGRWSSATRFADWATCEAALAPPPLAGTSAASFERLIRSHHPDWPESGIAGDAGQCRGPSRMAPSGPGCRGPTT